MILNGEEWMAEGICTTVDPDMWFPASKQDPNLKAAIKICKTCPVIKNCAAYAERTQQSCGVWGGKLIGIRPKVQFCWHVPRGEACPICLIVSRRERAERKAAVNGPFRCGDCNKTRNHKAKGLCGYCYKKRQKEKEKEKKRQAAEGGTL